MNNNEKDQVNQGLDWDMMDDYYTSEGNQNTVRSFDEIVKETEASVQGEADVNTFADLDPKLLQTIEDVKKVKEASVGGATIEQIAERLNMDKDYVRLILMTREGYAEDSDIAVAHLVLLG